MLVVVGLSHRSAPVDVREQVALPEEALPAVLGRLAAVGGGSEAMVVSTCNRVEVYLSAQSPAGGAEQLRQPVAEALVDGRPVDGSLLARHLYAYEGEAALRHLFRVASSLDSIVVGESQILGQMKDGWEAANRAGTVGTTLGRAVPKAFAAAKRVRTETEIGRQSASVSSAAVDLARHIFGDLRGKEVLVIGAGKMGGLAAKHLVASGAGPLLVCNRTLARGEALAAQLGGQAHPFTGLEALLARADVVVCSTGAPEPVIRRDLVQRVMKVRRGRWLCLIDIAVPRDVETPVGDVENVYLYDVDALQQLVGENLAERRRAAEFAERIVAEEVQTFLAGERSLGVVPTIRALRERFQEIARDEAERTLGRLSGASARERKEIEALADAIVGKLLHGPLTALKREADPEPLVTAARTLFSLDEAAAPEAARERGEAGRGAK